MREIRTSGSEGAPGHSGATRLLELSDAIQQEDVAICEAVQRGVKSRSYDRGRYSTRFERVLHHFQGLLTEFLNR